MKHNKGEEINGWLVVDKPRGMGSTDVVRRTKRLFRAKKMVMPGRWILLQQGFYLLRSAKRQSFCLL